MKFLILLLSSLLITVAQAEPCGPHLSKELCDVFERLNSQTSAISAPYFWARTADHRIMVPRIGVPNGLLCYDAVTGGRPKNPDLCRRVSPTTCEWGENMSGKIRCYENYEGRMVGGGPINDYLCRQPALCTPENLAAEDHFY